MQLVAVEAWTRPGGGRKPGTSTVLVKPPTFDGHMSCTLFHLQFQGAADHISWTVMHFAGASC
jgi:hypothetical protein